MGIDGADARSFGQDAHEPNDAGPCGLTREMILSHQPDDVATLADHDLGLKGKSARQFGTELRLRDRPPDHEGTRRADVDGIEMLQLFGERFGSKGPVTTNVDPSQKNHECHALFSCWRRLRPVERPRRREPCDVGGGQRLLHGEFVQYLLDTFWYRDRDKPRTRVKIVFARFVDDTHEVASGGIRILEDFVNLADLERAGVFAVMNADYNCFGSVICRVQESV